MSNAAEIVIGLVGAALLAFSVYGTFIGLGAWIEGERLERCRSCKRFGLTTGGDRHPEGCPPRVPERLSRAWHTGGILHVRHH